MFDISTFADAIQIRSASQIECCWFISKSSLDEEKKRTLTDSITTQSSIDKPDESHWHDDARSKHRMCTGTDAIDVARRTDRWTLRWIRRETEELIARRRAA